MATLTVQLSGSGVVTGTKSCTVSDGDLQSVLNWAATAFASSLPQSPTNQQILQTWVQSFINGTTDAMQVAGKQVTTPAPVVFT
jgi:hypothetical protein